MAKEQLSFEQAVTRLEKIVDAMEQGKIGLENSVTYFEEGMGLIARCRKVLSEAEMKIQQLQASGESGVKASDGRGLTGP